MAQSTKLQIAVIGAGIAGLATAISLKDHPGIEIAVYERASKLQEIGASIALGPNGMRTLERLGAENALNASIAFRNKSGYPMIYRHWKTDEVVSIDSHREPVEYRHLTARFYRPHLQQALLEHLDPSKIHLAKAFQGVAYNRDAQKLIITFGDGTTTTADLLFGADGIHSAVRKFFVPDSQPSWTGWVTFRSVFPFSHVSHIPNLPDEANHFWGPNRTLFVSKLGRNLFTVVGSYQSDPESPNAPYKDATWNSEGDVDVLKEYYKDWSPLTRAIIDATPYTRIYPNTAAHGLESWVLGSGRVTLAGDAAHAHGGAFAAGGSLALDDAWAFGAAITHVFPEGATRLPTQAELLSVLKIYEATRKAHTDKVIQTVHTGNKKKLQRLDKIESDTELKARMKGRENLAWLHEHDVVGSFWNALAAREASQGLEVDAQARL